MSITIHSNYGGGFFHTCTNIIGTINSLKNYQNHTFNLIINVAPGAFGYVFNKLIDINFPNNIKSVSYIFDKTDKHVYKTELELSNLSDTKNHIYLSRGKLPAVIDQLKIKPNVMKQIINKTIQLDYTKLISVHYRNTDYKNDINETIQEVDKNIKNNYSIYLATDDYESILKFKKHYGSRLIQLANIESIGDSKNFHRYTGSIDQETKLFDFLVDLYVLYRSPIVIYSKQSSLKKFMLKIKSGEFKLFC